MTQPDTPERAQRELGLQLSLGLAWMGDIPRPEWENAITRARTLCQQTGRVPELCWAAGQLSIYHYVRGEYQKATEYGTEALSLAEQVGDPLVIAISHWYLGFIFFGVGEFARARQHLTRTLASYEPQQHHRAMVLLRGTDAGLGALAYDACCLWCLGYAERAVLRSREALTLARTLGHAFSSADALTFGGCVFNALARDASALRECAAELTDIASEMEFSSFGATGSVFEGIAFARLGSVPEGIARIRRGLERVEATGTVCVMTLLLGSLAEALAEAGQWSEALATFDEALALADKTGEGFYQAELQRLRAELLLVSGDPAGAEAGLRRAIKVARKQRARMWELRAATSLGRVLHEQSRDVEARAILARSHGWFTEGFDTAELRAAVAALAELS
jgi:adenylate cyclase